MGSVTIRPVRNRRQLKRFVKVPFHLHRDRPQWVPPLIFERMQFLDRKKNPWFEHGEAEYFLAERDGEPVGRITAHVDSRWDEFQGGSDDTVFVPLPTELPGRRTKLAAVATTSQPLGPPVTRKAILHLR